MSAATGLARAAVRGRPTITGVPVAYERISSFRVEGRGLDGVEVSRGVDRQTIDNEGCAEALQLGEIAEHFTDNNRSASQFRTKERERWDAMLAFVRSGRASHVIVWLLDRAYRTTDDCEALLSACREGGALIVQSATHDIADPHNPDDMFRLKLAGILAEYEVAKMSVRQRRAKQAAAELGKAHGGRRRFGYEPGMVALRDGTTFSDEGDRYPDEAGVIRDLVKRLLGGESLSSLRRWLIAEEIATPQGGKWTGANLRHMLMGPHLAGQRVHRGEIIGEASWPKIIDLSTHEAVVSLLSDPARRTSHSNARTYLLAGLGVCATCGEPLRGRPTYRGKSRAYACATGRHCHRSVELVDAVVTEAMVSRLESIDMAGVWQDDDRLDEQAHLEVAREALRIRADEAAEQFAEGTISATTLATVTSKIEAEQARVETELGEARLAAKRPMAALDGLTGERARDAWLAAPLGRRRAAIAALCTVRLHGALHGREPFDPDKHVTIDWHDLA